MRASIGAVLALAAAAGVDAVGFRGNSCVAPTGTAGSNCGLSNRNQAIPIPGYTEGMALPPGSANVAWQNPYNVINLQVPDGFQGVVNRPSVTVPRTTVPRTTVQTTVQCTNGQVATNFVCENNRWVYTGGLSNLGVTTTTLRNTAVRGTAVGALVEGQTNGEFIVARNADGQLQWVLNRAGRRLLQAQDRPTQDLPDQANEMADEMAQSGMVTTMGATPSLFSTTDVQPRVTAVNTNVATAVQRWLQDQVALNGGSISNGMYIPPQDFSQRIGGRAGVWQADRTWTPQNGNANLFGTGCSCDNQCISMGDCCADYSRLCGGRSIGLVGPVTPPLVLAPVTRAPAPAPAPAPSLVLLNAPVTAVVDNVALSNNVLLAPAAPTTSQSTLLLAPATGITTTDDQVTLTTSSSTTLNAPVTTTSTTSGAVINTRLSSFSDILAGGRTGTGGREVIDPRVG